MDLEAVQKGADTLFENEHIIVFAPAKGVAEGHILLYPKKGAKTVDDLAPEEMEALSLAASYIAAALFETMGAHGTNIVLVEEDPRLHFDVIARKEGDSVNLLWDPKQLGENEMADVQERLKDSTFMIGKEDGEGEEPTTEEQLGELAPERPETPKVMTEEELKEEEEKENYMIRQLYRIP